jgi:hypothetical protein
MTAAMSGRSTQGGSMAPRWTRFAPGDAVAVVGPGTTVLMILPDGVALADVTARVWPSVESAAPLADIVDAVSACGGAELLPFALVRRGAGRTHVMRRGDVQVWVDGALWPDGTDSPGAGPGPEAASDAEIRLVAGSSGAPGTEGYLLGYGVVPASSVVCPGDDADDDAGAAVGDTVAPAAETRLVSGEGEGSDGVPPVDAPEADYDHLFGATIVGRVEDAAVRPPQTQEPAPRPNAEPPRATLPPPDADLGDHDGHTVRGGQAPSRPRVRRDPPVPPAGIPPMVQSRVCSVGHPNPPEAGLCRVCRTDLRDAAVMPVPRPALGVFTFDDGRTVVVDRPMVVGRSPKASSFIGGELPFLLALPGASGDVSRSHLEVRLDGWLVFVVDLDSANGSTVRSPGQPERVLRRGEPVALALGTVVTLADEVSFIFGFGS